MQILQPTGWPRPKGYSNGIVARGRLVFLAGMIGWNEDETFDSDDIVGQTARALANIVRLLREAGGGPEHIARMTLYVADRDEYLASRKDMGRVYREVIGRIYPAMTVVEVAGFVEDGARIEIEVTAVIPDN